MANTPDPINVQDTLEDMQDTFEIPADKADVEETEDGGAIVTIDTPEIAHEEEFYMNLAEMLPETELNTLATTLLELVERDKEARKLRDKQYEEGIRRTGLGDDAPGGAQFQGASRVVHPMLTEACVDFSSRVMKELFPANGPVKEKIFGTVTAEKVEKADRKKKFMNWQLTEQMVEFRPELEQTTTQIPMGGAQYIKGVWDDSLKRPRFFFVPIDEIYLPYAATSFLSAERKTHAQSLTKQEYESRIASGMYRDVEVVTSQEPELTGPQKANEKVEGKEQSSYNEDGLRLVLEIDVRADVIDEDGLAPYLISIDHTTRKVLSIYRNWDPDDELKQALVHIVEFPFVPWRGAYPIGLPHMIGSLSAAATGSLRALLDSAHINNFPGMLKLKGAQVGGQSDRIEPTQVTEIDGGVGIDDIRKIAMSMPFNPPSQVLYSLLGFVVEAGKGVVRTTYEQLADQNPNMPVGTTLALIEQGMTVFSAIHERLHYSMQQLLRVLHRINAKYLDDEYIVKMTGEHLAFAADFRGPIDITPVSDPNIFSETQRFAQTQAVMQRAKDNPLYDQYKVEEMFLKRLKIPDGTDLLVQKKEPHELDAINENIASSLGQPIMAFPEQDHLAHIQAHLDFLRSPVFGMNPVFSKQFLPPMIQHVKEHMVYYYARTMYENISQAAGADFEELADRKNPEIMQEYDRVIATASQHSLPTVEQTLSGVAPIITQAMQMLQQMSSPPPSPVDAVMQDTQRKAQADAVNAQLKLRDLSIKEQEVERQKQLDAIKMDENRADLVAKVKMNNADNDTAVQLATMKDSTHVSTHPNPHPYR